ncbi:restriction endonuclease [Candidatus Falkowbacteria bacterium]|nr:restriction endonuclease [Candidatus Falkowbacteria bacterium]
MLSPLKDLPFTVIIKSISGFSVLPFQREQNVVDLFGKSFVEAASEINKNGIKANRPNEVGNYIEPFIKTALKNFGFFADVPTDSNGKKKATGYPDIEMSFNEKHFYLEVKTYNIKNINTTQRSFYFSPSENFKITKDAPHLLISYQMEKADNGLYYAKHWKFYSLENLKVDLKHEFNQNNKKMYGDESYLDLILEKEI